MLFVPTAPRTPELISHVNSAPACDATRRNVQGPATLVKLPDGSAMLLTYVRYLGPDGSAIHEKGLQPEVLVDVPDNTPRG